MLEEISIASTLFSQELRIFDWNPDPAPISKILDFFFINIFICSSS